MPVSLDKTTYTSAGGVVINAEGDEVLLLIRPERDEVRLPKGHVEPGEDLVETALREVREETGYGDLEVLANLGEQLVTFLYKGETIRRTEHYYLMRTKSLKRIERPEADAQQFFTVWVAWTQAKTDLTFEAEREWILRARRFCESSEIGSGYDEPSQ